jgi:hypothetical protein
MRAEREKEESVVVLLQAEEPDQSGNPWLDGNDKGGTSEAERCAFISFTHLQARRKHHGGRSAGSAQRGFMCVAPKDGRPPLLLLLLLLLLRVTVQVLR